MSRSEPKVTIKRIDTSISATINNSRATTYIGIESDTGRYDLQEVQSSKQLIQKYSTKSKPSKSDSTTLLHAGKFTEGFVAHIIRVNKDKIFPGIDSLGNFLYFDESYNMIDNLTDIKISGIEDANTGLYIIYNNTLYYNSDLLESTDTTSITVYYVNTTITSYTTTKAELYTVWSDAGYNTVLVDYSDAEDFLNSFANLIASDEYYLAYTNYSSYNFSIIPISSTTWPSAYIERFIQFCSTYSYECTSKASITVLSFMNNGYSVNYSESTLYNRMFNNLNNYDLTYNSVIYSCLGSSTKDVVTYINESEVLTNCRDSLYCIIEAINSTETRGIHVYSEQYYTLTTKDYTDSTLRFYYSNDSTGVVSQLTGDLANNYTLQFAVYDEDSGDWSWVDVDSTFTDQTADTDLAWVQSVRLKYSGASINLSSGSLILNIGELNSSGTYDKRTVIFYYGTAPSYSADVKFNITSVNDIMLDILFPLYLCDQCDYIEEYLPELTNTDDNKIASDITTLTLTINNIPIDVSSYIDSLGPIYTTTYSNYNYYKVTIVTSENTDDVFYLKIGNYVFYNYTTPDVEGTYVNVSNNKITYTEFLEKVSEIIYDYFTVVKLSSSEFLISGTYEVSASNLEVEVTEYTQVSDARFAVIQKFTSADSLSKFEVEVDEDDNELIYITTDYNSTSYEDTISFNPDKLDGYGVNVYYNKYNTYDRDFHITELNEEGGYEDMESIYFGGEIIPKSASIQDYIDALDDLRNLEFKPYFLFDGGLSNLSYYKSLATFADEVHAMVPAAPPCYTETNGKITFYSVDKVKSWKNSLGYSTERVIYDGWQNDVVFGDIPFYCSPAYYYLQLVLSNTNSVNVEFMPIFWKSQGRIQVSDPVNQRTKSERTELLDYNINSVVRNTESGYSYFNMNLTDQSYESDWSEEQNVRISNKIAHIADEYIDLNVLGKYHTLSLRDNVCKMLTSQIQTNIMDNRQDMTASSFRVIVDETNNPDITSRTLVVDIYVTYGHSITEVLVYSRTETLE